MPANRARCQTASQDDKASPSQLHQTAFWAFDPSFCLLFSAFRPAHRLGCGGLLPPVTLHLLLSLLHLAPHSDSSPQEQPFSPAWHMAAFCTSNTPSPAPSLSEGQLLFFPAGILPLCGTTLPSPSVLEVWKNMITPEGWEWVWYMPLAWPISVSHHPGNRGQSGDGQRT